MIRKTDLATALHAPRKKPAGLEEAVSAAGMHANAATETTVAPGTASRSRRPRPQGMGTDQFLYFFLRLRKNEVRRVVQRAKSLYPGDTPEKLARRLVNTQCALSFLGGALLYLPQMVPVAGNALKIAGFAGGASVMTRMHLYLILEIALLFDHDIDDQARVPEMMAIIAASGISATSPYLVTALNWHRLAAIPTSGLTVVAITQMIGAAAIRHYKRQRQVLASPQPFTEPQPAGA